MRDDDDDDDSAYILALLYFSPPDTAIFTKVISSGTFAQFA